MIEQVVALKLKEAPRQTTLPRAHNHGHGDARVVVGDPPGNLFEELKRPDMPLPERLGAFAFKRRHEEGVAVGQRHHEKGNQPQLASDPRQGVPEIHLRLAGRMLEWDEDLLSGLPNPPDGLLHRRVTTGVALLVPQPLPDPLGRVPLLLGQQDVVLEDLLDLGLKRPDLRSGPRFALPIAQGLTVRQDLLQRPPVHPRLPQDAALALSVNKHPSSDLIPLFHVGIHAPF